MRKGSTYSVQTNAAGSPLPGEPVLLAVGKLRHTHGIHGEMFVEILTDFPDRLQTGMALYLGTGAEPLQLVSCRRHQKGLLMAFEGYTTPEQLSQFRNQLIYVSAADRPPLAEGEYYHHQLIGLHVNTVEGTSLGNVKEILETGACDVLVVKSETGSEVLIPTAGVFIENIDLAKHEITVHLIPGMVEEG